MFHPISHSLTWTVREFTAELLLEAVSRATVAMWDGVRGRGGVGASACSLSHWDALVSDTHSRALGPIRPSCPTSMNWGTDGEVTTETVTGVHSQVTERQTERLPGQVDCGGHSSVSSGEPMQAERHSGGLKQSLFLFQNPPCPQVTEQGDQDCHKPHFSTSNTHTHAQWFTKPILM